MVSDGASAVDEGSLLFEGSVRHGVPSYTSTNGNTDTVPPIRLEERVYLSKDVLEGVRWALFSELSSSRNEDDGNALIEWHR